MSTTQVRVPSTKRLLKATVIAVIVACTLLITIVLPAEYGIDPTGIGTRLGLNKLGEAASATEPSSTGDVAEEKQAVNEAPATEEKVDAVGQPLKAVDDSMLTKHEGDYRVETMTVTLEPGKGAEIKARMKGGESFVFHWAVTGGEVASDFHGEKVDAKKDEYTSYWIDGAMASASGSFTAPFEGRHGWYWLNRGDKPVTVTVKVTGFYQELFRP